MIPLTDDWSCGAQFARCAVSWRARRGVVSAKMTGKPFCRANSRKGRTHSLESVGEELLENMFTPYLAVCTHAEGQRVGGAEAGKESERRQQHNTQTHTHTHARARGRHYPPESLPLHRINCKQYTGASSFVSSPSFLFLQGRKHPASALRRGQAHLSAGANL